MGLEAPNGRVGNSRRSDPSDPSRAVRPVTTPTVGEPESKDSMAASAVPFPVDFAAALPRRRGMPQGVLAAVQGGGDRVAFNRAALEALGGARAATAAETAAYDALLRALVDALGTVGYAPPRGRPPAVYHTTVTWSSHGYHFTIKVYNLGVDILASRARDASTSLALSMRWVATRREEEASSYEWTPLGGSSSAASSSTRTDWRTTLAGKVQAAFAIAVATAGKGPAEALARTLSGPRSRMLRLLTAMPRNPYTFRPRVGALPSDVLNGVLDFVQGAGLHVEAPPFRGPVPLRVTRRPAEAEAASEYDYEGDDSDASTTYDPYGSPRAAAAKFGDRRAVLVLRSTT
jgi:hypothetical protein